MHTFQVSSTLQFWHSWDNKFCFVNKDTKVSIFHKQELNTFILLNTRMRSTGSELWCLKMPLSYGIVMHLPRYRTTFALQFILSPYANPYFLCMAQSRNPASRETVWLWKLFLMLFLAKVFLAKMFLFIIHTSRKVKLSHYSDKNIMSSWESQDIIYICLLSVYPCMSFYLTGSFCCFVHCVFKAKGSIITSYRLFCFTHTVSSVVTNLIFLVFSVCNIMWKLLNTFCWTNVLTII